MEVIMKIKWVVFLGIYSLIYSSELFSQESNYSFIDPKVSGHNLLIIGDSLSCGPFGAQLVKNLRDQGEQVTLYCAVSSSPYHWLKGVTPKGQKCRTCTNKSCEKWYTSKSPDEDLLQLCNGNGKVPKLETLLQNSHEPVDEIVVALGTNSLPAKKTDTYYSELTRKIGDEPRLNCIWVGPPHFSTDKGKTASKMDLSLIDFYPALDQVVSAKCELIDSRPFTSKPKKSETTSDGVHRTNNSGRKWGDDVSRIISGLSLY